jgi:acetyltransferase-like isoleucine patch superfamily enzyme
MVRLARIPAIDNCEIGTWCNRSLLRNDLVVYSKVLHEEKAMNRVTTLTPCTDETGNSIEVGSSPSFAGGSILFKEQNAKLKIGHRANLNHCTIELGRNSVLEIGDDCRINGRITVGYNSLVRIGRGLSVTRNINIRAVESTSITIGEDCLFGSDITIRTTDGHPIYDAKSRERINASKSIAIGNHVWIADSAYLLKGVTIGDASVVGACSLVTKSVPDHCVCAGNPARVVKTGITWERSPGVVSEAFYLD